MSVSVRYLNDSTYLGPIFILISHAWAFPMTLLAEQSLDLTSLRLLFFHSEPLESHFLAVTLGSVYKILFLRDSSLSKIPVSCREESWGYLFTSK